MTPDALEDTFSILRDHSSPLVWPLLDSIERTMKLERESLEAIQAKVALLDGMLSTRVAMTGRDDD